VIARTVKRKEGEKRGKLAKKRNAGMSQRRRKEGSLNDKV
jgi:hypothetical protein